MFNLKSMKVIRISDLISLVLWALVSGTIWAGDGQVEFNQAAVDAAGGFPFEINQPGSYVLTGNLETADPNGDVILITEAAEGAVIDLNGFTISGISSCTRVDVGEGDFDTQCSNTGTGNGIDIRASFVTVRNGVVRGMGSHGITGGFEVPGIQVESLVVSENGGGGIKLSNDALVTGCRASRNGEEGILVSQNSKVLNNLALENALSGITAGGVIRNNVAHDNDIHGIFASSDSVVAHNVATSNDSFGLSLSTTTGYFGNTMNDNGSSSVFAGINLGHNMCGGVACP